MYTIRKAQPSDEQFIISQAYRLIDFGPPAWREQKTMTMADQRHNLNALHSENPDIAVFVAVDDDDQPCGFIHLSLPTDYYTQEKHAHVTDIVVSKEAEGIGVGKLLLAKADEWAYEKNARWVTLNVFDGNEHARAVYEKAGYQKEWIKYLKELTPRQ